MNAFPAHHIVGADLGFTCTNCGGHTSTTAPCIPARVYPLASAEPSAWGVEALDHDEWCICSTEFRAAHGDAHTRICSQQWGDLTRLLARVRREGKAAAIRAWDEGFAAADQYREDVQYGDDTGVPLNPHGVER